MSKQKVVRFGAVTPLAGILTEPVGGASRERPSVIILNSGILHHVGANRLHVQLARRLADLGFATLRFDFSGLGDSDARRDSRSFEESSPIETREAIDYMSRAVGTRGAILMGLCSGADAAHLAALGDDRVVGLGMLIRGPTGRPVLCPLLRLSPGSSGDVCAVAASSSDRLRAARSAADVDEPNPGMYDMPEYIRVFPPRERVAAELREFLGRGVELNVIFSGGLPEYNHQGQYRASFSELDFGDRLEETYVAGATHVFTALAHQERVVKVLSAWADRRFGDRSAPVAPVEASGVSVG